MSLDNLFIPGKYARLFAEISDLETIDNQSGDSKVFLVPESWFVHLFESLGAIHFEKMNKSESKNEKVNQKNETAVIKNEQPLLLFENQPEISIVPQALLDVIQQHRCNFFKGVMIWKNLSLKMVAERYGGKSAAANLSNFMARTDAELASMRKSTVQKLADVTDTPAEWFLHYLRIPC